MCGGVDKHAVAKYLFYLHVTKTTRIPRNLQLRLVSHLIEQQ